MNIHEYQSRDLLEKFGVPVPAGIVVDSAEGAGKAFDEMAAKTGVSLAVVKAQVHAGGRGKGGGVKLVKSAEEARTSAEAILSKPLITPQTTAEGVTVHKLLVAAGVDIEKEFYLAIAVDRAAGNPVLIASTEGGMDIEAVAAETPDKILREPIDPTAGLLGFQARKIAFLLGFKGKAVGQAAKVMTKLVKLFLATDASLAEINPLILTPADADNPDGQVLAIDAKINFDDNALFRHDDIQALADPNEEDADEARANKFGLTYIKLDGNIGCLVNGAGLAMATMDIIKLYGGAPANFLDVGGSASQEAVANAFSLLVGDPSVKTVLINIFGGIARTDRIAAGVVDALAELGEIDMPVVVRLEGTNVEKGRQILHDADFDFIVASQMGDAAEKAVAAAKGAA